MNESIQTSFLPAKRADEKTIQLHRALIAQSNYPALFDDFPISIMILNQERQILWANKHALSIFTIHEMERICGMRPGEAVGCIHATNRSGGCGTSEFCSFCGAAQSISQSVDGMLAQEECVIQRRIDNHEEGLDLLVWSKPVSMDGVKLILLNAQDISAKKHSETLERIFYHDIGNTVSGIHSLVELLRSEGEGQKEEYLDLMESAAEQLMEEIDSQRGLQAVEERNLAVVPEFVDAREIIEKVVTLFRYRIFGHGKQLLIDPDSACAMIFVDPILLRRVVVNMCKNALEASARGEVVKMRSDTEGSSCVISVSNPSVMSDETQLRVFERSFSTKGQGRGLGTYGMKLIAERYLDASVGFESRPGTGTRFWIRIPLGANTIQDKK